MPTDAPTLNSLIRFFRTVPYQDYFQTLADTLDEAVFVISSDSQRVLSWNRAFLLLSGYSQAEVEELEPANLLPNNGEEKVLEKILECLTGTDCRLSDVPLRTREGTFTQIDLHASPIGPSHSALLLIAHPTIARIHVEDHRRAQEERLEVLTEISNLLPDAGISAIPEVLKLAQRLLQTESIAFYRVSATEPDYIMDGQLPSDFPQRLSLSELDPIRTVSSWRLGQRPDHILQKAARTAGFNQLWISPAGTESAWIGFLVAGWRDETSTPANIKEMIAVIANLCHVAVILGYQKASIAKSEKVRSQLEEEIQGQFDSIPNTLIVVDSNLTVIKANPAITRMLGYQPQEVTGLPIQDVLVGPEDVLTTLLDAQGHQRAAEHSRIALHHRDGTPLLIQLRAIPLPNQAKHRLMLILKDQSEQKEIEDQTETLAQRALLGEVMAIFAHEVRNPINNISTGVQLVASRLGKDNPLYHSLEMVHRECNRLDQLMSDVLFFSRPLELKIETFDLADHLERILARWKPRFNQAGVTCHTSYDADTPSAYGDVRTLEQVIVNLITNALEAMPGGGTISVALAPAEAAQGRMVELKIADTGPGIPPDVVDRIFDPFFTTKKDGTGLGLAISRRILVAHKGIIQVESFPDAGTVFSIMLPVE